MAGEKLTPALARMMLSGDFSDLKFVCRGNKFNVHKAIVCGHSPVIRAAIQGDLQDSSPNVINMDEFDPSIVEQFVKFLYTGDYDDCKHQYGASMANRASDKDVGSANKLAPTPLDLTKPKACGEETPPSSFSEEIYRPTSVVALSLAHHVRVNCIADHYGVETLVSLADTKIRTLLDSQNEDKTWVPGLPAATKAALASTRDDELTNILASATVENLSTLVGMQSFKSLESINDFALKVLKSCDQKIQGLVKELKEAKCEIQNLDMQLENRESVHQDRMLVKDAKIADFRRCIQILDQTDVCRNTNCDTRFGCYIDTDERTIRCSRCRCRHRD